MNVEEVCAYCLAKKGVEDGFPFGETTMVFKVMGKIFALVPLDVEVQTINLKCDPDWAVELRETHPDDILPGYHMNKQHWNTVQCEGGLSTKLLQELIDHSYDLIVKSLPKKTQAELAALS
jgi:predicted DNA-binding protein (MmcQ/YjbR family)